MSGEVEGGSDVGGWGKRLPSELFFESEREDGGGWEDVPCVLVNPS